MAAIYEVERADEQDPERDRLIASYGWAHFHAFTSLLAAEEGVDLTEMSGYGGENSWSTVATPLRPLFDLDCFDGGRLPARKCQAMQSRLHEVCELWSRGAYAGKAEEQMKIDQLNALRKLVAVVDGCVDTGRAMIIR
ncbi:hypothetical protein Drose_34905 [Dactylosporangium roseum]|uniref:Uncharacterized protein n=1 Tax=Dactylosporangium roseum TaxID=47989 RepID=A0ABY5Z2F9_9ACTN|nr:hypothetical protein [Dactylosporangium roseum]UWZ36190.1 hypothetical protein Drose_34905 [Dactylosporangium roseum]